MAHNNLSVEHQIAENQFQIVLGEKTAVVQYANNGEKISFFHTEVPPEYRGQGIAAQLVEAALAYSREENLKVVPLCSYVAEFIASHSDYQDLL